MLINILGKLFVLVGIDKFDSRRIRQWLHLCADEIKIYPDKSTTGKPKKIAMNLYAFIEALTSAKLP